jgi:hypothetical protein
MDLRTVILSTRKYTISSPSRIIAGLGKFHPQGIALHPPKRL